ncbi:antibiotic biosynthesis monooxygenase [Pseudomonas moraviensis subsp. stanleyae]|uniref:putative quinol monooxygenase n=1 Tax=Pseudomonas moraviensis TaxID=321662 RepID=UPI002E2FE89C|nr:putative quinol monooxygenase [Pseudomonas moraviensis]MED7666672.1 antibiotic biosynthesis monooxygenase [Pseudomonas moraviensis subsp. stanleyae]
MPETTSTSAVGIIARIQVKTGTDADFELLANDLVRHSREEPGCLAYDLWRVEGESEGSYAFIERYVDSAAADAHRRTDHFRQIGRKMGEYLAGAPVVMQLKSA